MGFLVVKFLQLFSEPFLDNKLSQNQIYETVMVFSLMMNDSIKDIFAI